MFLMPTRTVEADFGLNPRFNGPWSSLEEGDEQLDRPNSQTCME